MKFFNEALTSAQLEAARRVGPVVTQHGGHLAGGTAASLYLCHRRSVDLDFFFQSLPDPGALGMELQMQGAGVEIVRVESGTLHACFAGVPVSFLEFKYAPLTSPLGWSKGKCRVASVSDIAAMKLSAVAQRGHRKDFYDVFALGSGPCPLPEMVAAYQGRFAIRDPGRVLAGLTYFTDADAQRDPVLLKTMRWEEVKRTIQEWVRDFVNRFPG